MSAEEKKPKCRCTNCGYIHPYTESYIQEPPGGGGPPFVPPGGPPAAAVLPVPPPDAPQLIRCPLCGALFTEAEKYTAHRAADCKPIAETAPTGDTTPPPGAPPADDTTPPAGDPALNPLTLGESDVPQ